MHCKALHCCWWWLSAAADLWSLRHWQLVALHSVLNKTYVTLHYSRLYHIALKSSIRNWLHKPCMYHIALYRTRLRHMSMHSSWALYYTEQDSTALCRSHKTFIRLHTEVRTREHTWPLVGHPLLAGSVWSAEFIPTNILASTSLYNQYQFVPVSYTHLTLPTNREV